MQMVRVCSYKKGLMGKSLSILKIMVLNLMLSKMWRSGSMMHIIKKDSENYDKCLLDTH